MLDGLFIVSIIGSCVQAIKESNTSKIPADNWANKDLIDIDKMNDVSEKQILVNARNGRYKIKKEYPKPHRNERGQIIIENSLLYDHDYRAYGALQTTKWVEQGKYNLIQEELKKEDERIKRYYNLK